MNNKDKFSIVMDSLTKEWLWYDYETKKFSEKYYETEGEARRAAAAKGKDANIPFNDEEE